MLKFAVHCLFEIEGEEKAKDVLARLINAELDVLEG